MRGSPPATTPKRVRKGSVRRGQLITTYGVGAIVPVGDESFMVAGLDYWPAELANNRYIHEPRLERRLGVQGFLVPPATEGRDIPVVRFPSVHSCPQCRRLDRHSFFTRFDDNKCGMCGLPLVPSRFVVACDKGHIDDFPYFEWVHKGTRPTAESTHTMSIVAGGVSASLSDIVISCSCGKASTMYGSFAREALRDVKKCTGRRPWLGDEGESCEEVPRTLQRGASNVYFSVIRSSISIPPWSEGALKIINRHWDSLRHVPASALVETLEGMGLAKGTAYTADDLALAVKQRKESEQGDTPGGDDWTMLRQEYEALVRGKAEVSADQEFVCVPAKGIESVIEWFEQVMLVTRLREVRALESFTRLLPPSPSDPGERRSPLSKDPVHWLPAIEVVGEGVFLRLNEARLRTWETQPAVVSRAEKVNRNYVARFAHLGRAPDRRISPRHLLIHTLAHAMISQWALQCGYPTASLQERLYVSDTMAGLLIYTATTDAAGSLGGIVAQADAGRLALTFREAIERASWCSSDPLCIESIAAGADALNLAACHACVLLPEVCCENANTLLDRGLVVGVPEDPEIGFFAPLLDRG